MKEQTASSITAETLKEATRVARIQLGPSSARLISEPGYLSLLLSRAERMNSLEDAVFSIVFEFGLNDQEISNEFFGSFLAVLHAKGRRLLAGNLERILGSQDLVQSVIGDLLAKPIEFQGRAQFLSYLDQGMRWKASSARGSARADRQLDYDPIELDTSPPNQDIEQPGLLSNLESEEDRERLLLGMLRLPESERELMRLYLEGLGAAEIAERTGRTLEATRSALARTRRKILDMFPGES
jgi:RNA polymerase sigma factor (sigma-70 family)